MLKHIQSLNKVFTDIKQMGAIIADIKSQFCIFDLKIVGYMCDINRKHLDAAKIIKI